MGACPIMLDQNFKTKYLAAWCLRVNNLVFKGDVRCEWEGRNRVKVWRSPRNAKSLWRKMHSKGLIPVSYEIVDKVIMWTGLFLPSRRENNSLRGSGGDLIQTTTWRKKSKSQPKYWEIWDWRLCILFTSWWDFWQYNSLVIFSSTWNIAMIFPPCSSDIPLFLWWFCNSFPQCLTSGIEHHRPRILQLFSHFLLRYTLWVFEQKRLLYLYLLGPDIHLALTPTWKLL